MKVIEQENENPIKIEEGKENDLVFTQCYDILFLNKSSIPSLIKELARELDLEEKKELSIYFT